MKKLELLRINDSLVKAMNYKNHEFAKCVFENKRIIEELLKEIDFFNDVPSKFIEYENKRIDLCQKTCQKDDNGMDVIINGRYEIIDQVTFKNQMDIFYDEYKEEISIRDKQIEKLNNILQEDINIPNFHKVSKENLPIDIQTASEMYEYSFMIS